MRDLTPVRLGDAGAVVVLRDGNGAEYAVSVTSLRTTLGRAGATPAPTDHTPRARGKEPTMESSLRPRDIQSRIRAGESPEDVAAVAGTAVEKVMIFASPVLAERAHVAQMAESASVRRSTPDPTSPAVATTRTLGAAVAVRLREAGVDPATVDWDSWRREDGRWTLQAGYRHDAAERQARFSFDQRGHFVAADDDEARWLVGDGQVPARTSAPDGPAAAPGLRLAPAYSEPSPAAPAPSPSLDRAPDRVSPRTPDRALGRGPVRTFDARPVDSRSVDSLGDDTLDLFSADADWMATVSEPDHTPEIDPDPPVDPAAPVAEPTPQETEQDHASLSHSSADSPADREPTVETRRTQLPPPTERTAPRPTSKRARGRASVPSWDEIMFGGGK